MVKNNQPPTHPFSIFDHVPMGVCVLGRDMVVLYWNYYLEQWTGLNRSTMVGAVITNHFPHLNSPKYAARLETVFEGGPPVIFSAQIHKHVIPVPLWDGQMQIQHTTVTALPAPNGDEFYALLSIQDVTDMTRRMHEYRRMRDQALEEIAEREFVEAELQRRNLELTLLNRIMSASATGTNIMTILQTGCRELSQAFGLDRVTAILMGQQGQEKSQAMMVQAEYAAAGATLPDCDPNEANPSLLTHYLQPLLAHFRETGAPLAITADACPANFTQLQTQLRQNGIESLLAVPLVINQELAGFLCLKAMQPKTYRDDELGIIQNVAGQLAGAVSHVQLNQQYQRLSAAIEQTAESVIITGSDGVIVYVNPACERISGYSRAEIIGQNPSMFKSGQHPPEFYAGMWAAIHSGAIWHGRVTNKNKERDFYIQDITIAPIKNSRQEITHYVSVQRDMTRELKLEEQYRQTEKMASIGQLAGGIAHDFNNLLTAINGFAELLKTRMAHTDPNLDWVEQILRSGQRAADLVAQLLAFSRKQIIQPKVLNLNEIVDKTDQMLRRIIGEDILLHPLPAPNLGQVRVDPTQFEQVILNLAVNARDAMPKGGQLTIETGNVTLDDHYAATHLEVTPGPYVMLAVTDTGTGMSKEVQAHIFEPFFTTKGVGKGTGLGLATIYGIVKQNNGHIWLYSEVGKGSTFKIYLPRHQEAVPPPEELSAAEYPLAAGRATILLVEDNDEVRSLTRLILQDQGYTLLEAHNGKTALQLAQSYPGTIDLLLTDVVMPGMSGRQLFKHLIRQRPGLKVVYMSGYTDNVIAHHGVLDAGIPFVEKPFSPRKLLQIVHGVLNPKP